MRELKPAKRPDRTLKDLSVSKVRSLTLPSFRTGRASEANGRPAAAEQTRGAGPPPLAEKTVRRFI